MPRKPSLTPPPYPRRPHGESGQARVKLNGRHVYLGVWGTPASHAEYERVVSQWRASRASGVPVPHKGRARTVGDVVGLYWLDCEQRYRGPDGAPKAELANVDHALQPLRALYGTTLIADFGPAQFRQLRLALVRGWDGGKGWCRNVVNRNVNRLKALFRWAASDERELFPAQVAASICLVRALARGEYGVRESDDVLSAPEEAVAATRPWLNPVVRTVVDLQLLTAARPGELLRLRPRDLLRLEKVEVKAGVWLSTAGLWVVQPKAHKTAHHGHRRLILLGPQAQAILAPLLAGRSQDAYLFDPREAMAWRDAQRRAARKSKVPPSQQCRRLACPKRKPCDHYTAKAYARSIDYAIRRAGCEHWHPSQLRHNACTRIVEQYGLEVARLVLGHTSVDTTQIYVTENLHRAAEAMRQVG